MDKINKNANKKDILEHFYDQLREIRRPDRYVPTDLESFLFELAGHRCSICKEPFMELHHISPLSEGGETSFDNLIVLCPNCHTRVHTQGIPNKKELSHYKIKQELANEFPVLERLTISEKELIHEVANLQQDKQTIFSKRYWSKIDANNPDEAVMQYRKEIGLFHLQECGMINVEQEHCIILAEGNKISVGLIARFTGKGMKWINYLKNTNRISIIN